MRLFLPSPRRMRNIVGASVLGVAAVMAFATPALACHGEISVKAECGNAEGTTAKVTWSIKVVGSRQGEKATVSGVKTNAGTLDTKDIVNGHVTEHGKTLTAVQTINISEGKAVLDLTLKFDTGYTWNAAGDAQHGPNVKELTGIDLKRCAANSDEQRFTVSMKSQCNSVAVTIKNDGDKPAKFTITGRGEVSVPGKRQETFTVPGAKIANGKVTVTWVKSDGSTEPVDTFNWAPTTCDTATAAPTTTGNGSLPVTGANVTVIAAVALLLLGTGGGLFLVARRRRIRFTV